MRNVTSVDALTSAMAGAPAGAMRRPLTTMWFERLIEMPESIVDGLPTRRIGALGERSNSCSGATRPAGSRIVPPLTLTRLSAALNQGGFCANW